uniref:Obg-like ATPase homolog n=1 Tax=Strombidium inclinatum TaxID=197538 RepID=A0A7S3MY08_9SPIT
MHVPAENFPFCTIDPNNAKINVPDKRFDKLCELYTPKSKVLAQISITDIAGLVKGASNGEGLGNAFLSHISSVDGIYHVVRAFPDTDVTHNDGEVDPIRDIETINHELRAKDLQLIERVLEEIATAMKRTKDKKKLEDELDLVNRVKVMLENKENVKDGTWSAKDIDFLNKHLFLTSKPVVFLVNIGRDQYIAKKNPWLPKIQEHIKKIGGGPMIPYSAEFESEVVADAKEDRDAQAAKAKELGAPSMIDRIIKAGYKHLQLIHYFTAGADEVKCWTVRDGSKAPQAAGVIHTDFERGFICAEVMKFTDLEEHGSEQEVRGAGLYRQQGKEYIVLDGDIIYFKFNVTAQKKK